jgi:hypothetical protein
MTDGRQTAASELGDLSEDEREWIPREISDAPPLVYAPRRPGPFDRSRSRLSDADTSPSTAEAEDPLELRIRQVQERGRELDQKLREMEEQVARAVGELERNRRG